MCFEELNSPISLINSGFFEKSGSIKKNIIFFGFSFLRDYKEYRKAILKKAFKKIRQTDSTVESVC